MLRDLVNDVPIGLLLFAAVAAALGLVLGLVWLVRRFVPAVRDGFDAEVSSQMLGVVAALFGLLFAFIIVIAYQNYSDARGDVSAEADALAAIVRDSSAFPEPEGDRVRSAVGTYVRIVVADEWPRLRDGEESPGAAAALGGMYRALQGVAPATSREIAFYDDSIRQLNTALVARRDRLDSSDGGLPWIVAALIVIGSIVIVGYAVVVGSRKFWFHALGAGSIAVVIALALVVLVDLNYPFSGDLAVDSGPFTAGALAQFFV